MAGSFPLFMDQAGAVLHAFKITGASVGASFSTDGLDLRGAQLCTIKKSSNTVTLKWNREFVDYYVFMTPMTANGAYNITSKTSAQLVFDGVERDDNTTTLADQDFLVFVVEYQTNQVVA